MEQIMDLGEGPGVSCAPEQGGDDMNEKVSRILLQYDESDANKLVDFGAKLKTNSKGEHLLVEVKEGSLAQQLELKNDDVIIELNAANITEVFLEALVLSLRDLGTKVQFIVNRTQEGEFYQGAVFFRLGPNRKGKGGVARIEYKNIHFIKFVDSTGGGEEMCVPPLYFVFIERPDVPPESAITPLGVYTLKSSKGINLQLTKSKGGDVYYLNIKKSALFTREDATIFLYEYDNVFGGSAPGNITAYASNPTSRGQYGVRTNGTIPGPVQLQTFPSFMTRKGIKISGNNFFFLLRALPDSAVDISTPATTPALHFTASSTNQLRVDISMGNDLLRIFPASEHCDDENAGLQAYE